MLSQKKLFRRKAATGAVKFRDCRVQEWTQFAEEAGGGREAIYNVIIDDGVAREINGVLFNSSLYLTRFRLSKVAEHN